MASDVQRRPFNSLQATLRQGQVVFRNRTCSVYLDDPRESFDNGSQYGLDPCPRILGISGLVPPQILSPYIIQVFQHMRLCRSRIRQRQKFLFPTGPLAVVKLIFQVEALDACKEREEGKHGVSTKSNDCKNQTGWEAESLLFQAVPHAWS